MRAARTRQRTAASAAWPAMAGVGASTGTSTGGWGASSGGVDHPGGATDARTGSSRKDTSAVSGPADLALSSCVRAWTRVRRVGHHVPSDHRGPLPNFELQFPIEQIPALAARFPVMDDAPGLALVAAARARGHYTRSEFIAVCGWKTVRSRPKVAVNSEAAVLDATGRALSAGEEEVRMS